jgi:hypothetical protein
MSLKLLRYMTGAQFFAGHRCRNPIHGDRLGTMVRKRRQARQHHKLVDLTGDDGFVTLDYEPYLNGSNPVPGDWNQVGRHRLLQQRRPGNMVRDFVFFFFEVLSKK